MHQPSIQLNSSILKQCIDMRNRPLNIGDWVACLPTGRYYSWSSPDYAQISDISCLNPPVASNINYQFELSFQSRKLKRMSHQVLKLEQ